MLWLPAALEGTRVIATEDRGAKSQSRPFVPPGRPTSGPSPPLGSPDRPRDRPGAYGAGPKAKPGSDGDAAEASGVWTLRDSRSRHHPSRQRDVGLGAIPGRADIRRASAYRPWLVFLLISVRSAASRTVRRVAQSRRRRGITARDAARLEMPRKYVSWRSNTPSRLSCTRFKVPWSYLLGVSS